LLLIGAALWLLPMGLLTLAFGWDGTLTQMGWFFTKAALLTFGGAYAVLPYVYQGAVGHYGWLSPTQMIDGLALGKPPRAADHGGGLRRLRRWLPATDVRRRPSLPGRCGRGEPGHLVHLPAVVPVHPAGGPLVESTHGEMKFTAPLTAITAAVVGVILNLALFFGYHVLWPNGFAGVFDWPSALIAAGAALALFRWRRGVIRAARLCLGGFGGTPVAGVTRRPADSVGRLLQDGV
jgi:chromate transporter